jgi:hypothetical protein
LGKTENNIITAEAEKVTWYHIYYSYYAGKMQMIITLLCHRKPNLSVCDSNVISP